MTKKEQINSILCGTVCFILSLFMPLIILFFNFEYLWLCFLCGLVLLVSAFFLQRLFLKASHLAVKLIPVYPILLSCIFCGLVATGLFSKGGGFLGNMHLLAAALLAAIIAFALIGNIAAWIVHGIRCAYKRRKNNTE